MSELTMIQQITQACRRAVAGTHTPADLMLILKHQPLSEHFMKGLRNAKP